MNKNFNHEMIQAEIMSDKKDNKEVVSQIINKVLSCRVDLGKIYSDDRNLLYYNGTPFLRKGNISIIQGKPKTGKSFLCSMLAAAAVTGQYEGITSYGGKPLGKTIYFDTEQSEEDAASLSKKILEMAGKPTHEFPDNFAMYSFRTLDPHAARTLFEASIAMESPSLVIVDGVTDLVDSPNDELEAKQRVAWLYNLASAYDTHILVVIHENSGSFDKARGHIGSELERKVETAMQVEVSEQEDNKIKRVSYKLSRKKSPDKFQFTIGLNGLPYVEKWTKPNSGEATRIGKEEMTLYRLKAAFDGKDIIPYDKLKVAIMAKAGVSEATARREIIFGQGLGYLVHKGNSYIFTKATPPQQSQQSNLPI